MNRKKLCIAIPASVVSDTPHLREKTSKIGLVGRAAAIFRANEIILYPDMLEKNQTAEMNLVALLLEYMETPQYLRKRLFKLKPELRYAGILPPLRTPHHPLNRKVQNLRVGEFREGVIISRAEKGVLVDIGVEKPVLLLDSQLRFGERVTVKVADVGEQVEVNLANHEAITEYWGYKVNVQKQPLEKILKSKGFDLVIGTSKYGDPFVTVAKEIAERWSKANSIAVVFGAPSQGLHEIAKREKLNLAEVMDFVVNTLPAQGTETVRTEEALIASLAILNINFNR